MPVWATGDVQSRCCSQRRSRRSIALLGVLGVVVAATRISQRAWSAPFAGSRRVPTQERFVSMQASVVDQVPNPVRTVSQTLDIFYKAYPQPPVLPMYRPFLVDLMTQAHLAVVDARFKYDALFGLGLRENFLGLMGTYDKIVGSEQTEKIWVAMMKGLSMDPDSVKADAEAVTAFAKATSAADILKSIEGGEASEAKVGEAFKSISSSLYSMPFSVGLFKLMENCGVELSKANTEEWAEALKITKSKVSSDLETYKSNLNKLQKAEEMLREIEIREKKKLAQRLEEKAKKLAAKAAAKVEEEKKETE